MTQTTLDFDRPLLNPTVAQDDRRRLRRQHARIIERLRQGPLTTLQAIHEMGILRLAARVHELKRAGYEIESDGQGAYWLK